MCVAAVAAVLSACGPGASDSAAAARYTSDLQTISDAIATAAGFGKEAIEMTSSRVRLRIAIRDLQLAGADPSARNDAAAKIVASAEKILAAHPEFASLEQISVAVIHATARGGAENDWHTEDVVEFRRGPNQRFTVHIS